MTNELAIHGGEPEIDFEFSRYNPISEGEAKIVDEVMKSGVLSDFVGASGEHFLGGKYVNKFEEKFSHQFEVNNSVSVNSWTSGLIAAVGALGTEPGDEILVTPWTMCASAIAILHWNAIPVFVDIEADTFCMDPAKIEENITERTRAILVVDIFGQSADMEPILEIARKHSLKVISDCAQSPGALYKGELAGTLSDIGGFSFNYHKHIHTGEGGMIVTNSDALARKCQLIRNHAEAAIDSLEESELVNMIGYNFRLGELESAIGVVQLDKLEKAIRSRQRAALQLNEGLKDIRGLKTPHVRADCTHVYYFYAMKHDEGATGVKKSKIYEALRAEGVPFLSQAYQCLHLLPMFQKKICYGSGSFPWSLNPDVDYKYGVGACPVAEDINENQFLGLFMCGSSYEAVEVDAIVRSFVKVYSRLEDLQ